MRVGHNISAIDTTRLLGSTTRKKSKIAEMLSSGYKINRASDNAAGLSISEKMRAQIRGLSQASRNAQDGISLIETADGALNEVHNILQRMRELSVQAANGTSIDEDRMMIQQEINGLVQEVTRISTDTEFNNMKLLDGSLQDNENPYMVISQNDELNQIINNDHDGIYVIYKDDYITQQIAAGNSTSSGNDNLKNLLKTEIVPQAVANIINTFSPAFDYLSSSTLGIGLNLYSDSSTKLASVSAYTYNLKNYLGYQLSVNTGKLSFDSNGNLTDESRQNLECTIAHEFVHGLMDEALTIGMTGHSVGGNGYTTTSGDKYPKWFVEGMAQTVAGGYADWNDYVKYGLNIDTNSTVSEISRSIKNYALTKSDGNTFYGTGYLACMYLGYLADGKNEISANSIRKGLAGVLSELIGGKSLNNVIKEKSGGKYSGLSDFENKFGDSESSKFVHDLTQKVGDGNGSIITGDLTSTDLLPNTPINVSVFTLDTNNDLVRNKYPDDVNVYSGGGASAAGSEPIKGYTSSAGTQGSTGGTVAPGATIDLSNISSIDGINYDSDTKTLTINRNGDYILKGTAQQDVHVVVSDGIKANVTLSNANITSDISEGIKLNNGADLTLNVSGNSTVISTTAAGIGISKDATLNITGNGKLTIRGKEKDYISEGTINNKGNINIPNGGTGDIFNHGSVAGISSGIKNYIDNIIDKISQKISVPSAPKIGDILKMPRYTPITVDYNGGKASTQLEGSWQIFDSNGSKIEDLSSVTVKQGDRYKFKLTLKISDNDLYFSNETSRDYNLVNNYNLVSSYDNVALSGSPVISDDGRSVTYTYDVAAVPSGSSSGSSSDSRGNIHFQIGANSGQEMGISIDGVSAADLNIDNLSVNTQEDAQKAIDSCNDAIEKVSGIRSKLGAYQNRLEHTISNLDNGEENLQSSESRIRDVDIAKGMAEYSKDQILLQVQQSILSQANQTASNVLNLLRA